MPIDPFVTPVVGVLSTQGRRKSVTAVADRLYTARLGDEILCVTALPAKILLPPFPTLGDTYEIRDAAGASPTAPITIDGNGNTIDSSPTDTIDFPVGMKTYVFGPTITGVQWLVGCCFGSMPTIPSFSTLTTGPTPVPNDTEVVLQTFSFTTFNLLTPFIYWWTAAMIKDGTAGLATFRLKVDGADQNVVTQLLSTDDHHVVSANVQSSVLAGPHVLELTVKIPVGQGAATYDNGTGIFTLF